MVARSSQRKGELVNKVSVAAAKALQAVWTGKEKPSKELAYHLHLFNKTVTRLLNERNEEQYVLLTFAEVAKRLDPTWWKSSSQGEQKKRLERMGHWARAVRNASACFTWIGIPMSKESAKGLPKVFSYLAEGRSAERKSTRLNSSHLGISYAVFC